MFFDYPLLSLVVWLPILGGIAVLLNGDNSNTRPLSLTVALVTLYLSTWLYMGFDISTSDMQFVEYMPWISAYGIHYHLGIDGFSMPLIILTAFSTVIVVIAGWEVIQDRPSQYMAAFLIMTGLMIAVFAALDAILFYVFFEAMLIPLFLVIGIWGGPNRVYATIKFFLYTFFGSVFLLIALLYLHHVSDSFSILDFHAVTLTLQEQVWLFFAFLIAFAVKVPMWPVHTWLPDAHVEAPTSGSVILAAILLKMAGYGFIRFSLGLFPVASDFFSPLVFSLSIIAIVYTSLVALVQKDMKKLIAYSSVAHMGFVTIGIFAFNSQGIEGSIFQMISHGIVSAALFLCVGVVYDRMHTRQISDYGGVSNVMPNYAIVFMIFILASLGLPGTSGFVGEILVLIGIFKTNYLVAFFAATGVVLSACYSLSLYRRVSFGEITNDKVKVLKDMNYSEFITLMPLLILVILLGVYPNIILDTISTSVENLVSVYNTKIATFNNLMIK